MKVTQEKLPASQIGLEIEIPADISKNAYEKVVQNLARSTNIPGFRQGKIPRQILLQRIGTQRIKAAALEELIEQSLKQAVEQEAIKSLGNYKLLTSFEDLIENYIPGEPLTISASLDVSPEITIADYTSLSVKATEVVYEPTEVDNLLEQRQKSLAIEIPVEDRPAQMEDIAYIDYSAFEVTEQGEAGETIEGVEGENFKVELSEGKFIDGFVEAIVGMNSQETKQVNLTFPADYPKEDLAGKSAIFVITLKELKTKELPELDDEFAKEVSEFETMAELRQSLETQYQEKAAKETTNNIHQAILDELLKQTEIELPETMLQKEIELILTQTAIQMQQLGIELKKLFTPESVSRMRENARPEAIQRLKEDLIIKEIAKRELIKPTPEAVKTRITEVQEQLGKEKLDLERLKQVVEDELVKESTLNWLQEKTAVELVPKQEPSESPQEETTGEGLE